jgi:hypothetical protein
MSEGAKKGSLPKEDLQDTRTLVVVAVDEDRKASIEEEAAAEEAEAAMRTRLGSFPSLSRKPSKAVVVEEEGSEEENNGRKGSDSRKQSDPRKGSDPSPAVQSFFNLSLVPCLVLQFFNPKPWSSACASASNPM